ncbi:hypothetical protein CF326_g2044 [Tilletia indica]|nr:hypothetical protein CF326_g2044 [Tilletia indica]
MLSFEQTVEPQSRAYQHLVVAAKPYETIASRIPTRRRLSVQEGIALPDNGAAAAVRAPIALGTVNDEPPTWMRWGSASKKHTTQSIVR